MTDDKPGEDGFEYQGTFYRWHISDIGKDLMLIDRFSGLPITEFFEMIEDDFDRMRMPVQLALIATSIRNGQPDWSVERIVRTVMDLSMSEIEFVAADREEDPVPLASEDGTAPIGAASSSPPRSLASVTVPETSATSNAIPA